MDCGSQGTFRLRDRRSERLCGSQGPIDADFLPVSTFGMDRALVAVQQLIRDPPSSARQGATMRWKTSIGLVIVTFFLLHGPGIPNAQAGVPSDQLRTSVEQALKVLGDGLAKREHPRERRVTLRKIADDIFDWDETAKRSLGPPWPQRSP